MGAFLDRSKPFGTVYGVDEDGAVYTQFGKKFRGDGTECGSPVPASPSSGSGSDDVEALKKRIAELESAATTNNQTSDDDDANKSNAESELSKLHPSQLKKAIEAKGGVAATGPGSAKENVKILLALLEEESAE